MQTHITVMEEILLGAKQDLKGIRLAQRDNQEAKVINNVDLSNYFSN